VSEKQPPEQTPVGDVPAAVEPDAPTEAQPSGESSAATLVDQPSPVTEVASVPEPPPAVPEPPPAVPEPPPAPEPPPVPEPRAWSPDAEPEPVSGPAALAADRPEVAVGAAFAGGLVLALILKRLAR
jgi:hypothetical protein